MTWISRSGRKWGGKSPWDFAIIVARIRLSTRVCVVVEVTGNAARKSWPLKLDQKQVEPVKEMDLAKGTKGNKYSECVGA